MVALQQLVQLRGGRIGREGLGELGSAQVGNLGGRGALRQLGDDAVRSERIVAVGRASAGYRGEGSGRTILCLRCGRSASCSRPIYVLFR